jgi:hypothetical protein
MAAAVGEAPVVESALPDAAGPASIPDFAAKVQAAITELIQDVDLQAGAAEEEAARGRKNSGTAAVV